MSLKRIIATALIGTALLGSPVYGDSNNSEGLEFEEDYDIESVVNSSTQDENKHKRRFNYTITYDLEAFYSQSIFSLIDDSDISITNNFTENLVYSGFKDDFSLDDIMAHSSPFKEITADEFPESNPIVYSEDELFAREDPAYNFLNVGDKLQTIDDVREYIENNISYKYDSNYFSYFSHFQEYFQSFESTVNLGTGDCEDGAIFAAAALSDNGYNGVFGILTSPVDYSHAIAIFKVEDKYYTAGINAEDSVDYGVYSNLEDILPDFNTKFGDGISTGTFEDLLLYSLDTNAIFQSNTNFYNQFHMYELLKDSTLDKKQELIDAGIINISLEVISY